MSNITSTPAEVARDEALLRRLIDGADLNVLRLVLLQLTGDPRLAAIKPEALPFWGGTFRVWTVPEPDRPLVKDLAYAFLKEKLPAIDPASLSAPDMREAQRLLRLYSGEPMPNSHAEMAYEELAFEPFPRRADWHGTRPDRARDFHVTIVGAGYSGLAVAVQLEQLGVAYTILERQSEIGGTWALNKYPGARVDIPSGNYQFKFEKNYDWKNFFATQKENQEYLQHCARKYGIEPNVRLDTTLVSGEWDANSDEWKLIVRRSDGAEESVSTNVVVSGAGYFSTPHIPDFRGMEDFKGKILIPTAWDQSYELAGKRVALIGSGSTGAQIMPAIASKVAHLTVLQRTPQWVMATFNYQDPVTPEIKWLNRHLPYHWNWSNFAGFVPLLELRGVFQYDREWQARGGLISERNDAIRASITDHISSKLADRPDLLKQSIPSYAPWGRRVVMDSGWFDALKRDNVSLLTDEVDHFIENGIVTHSGAQLEIDAVVLATGFMTNRHMWPVQYVGQQGVTIDDLWGNEPRTYLALTLPHFPNFFMLYGAPNAQPIQGTMATWAEIWSRYIAKAIVMLIESGARSIECRREAFESYNVDLDRELASFIWAQEGVGSYSVGKSGRPESHQPMELEYYFPRVAVPNPLDYLFDGKPGGNAAPEEVRESEHSGRRLATGISEAAAPDAR